MNYETRCFKIKLKPDSIEKAREWAKIINARKDEALAALRAEEVILETVFLDQSAEGDFLISIMKVESFEKSQSAVRQKFHEINEFHQLFKEKTWESHQEIELLIDLDRISEIT